MPYKEYKSKNWIVFLLIFILIVLSVLFFIYLDKIRAYVNSIIVPIRYQPIERRENAFPRIYTK